MKTIYYLVIVAFLLMVSSCGTYKSFYLAMESRGVQPQNKTYCVLPSDSLNIDYLEFYEYADALKAQLSKLGYAEDHNNPELKIYLQYNVGERFTIGSSSSTNTYRNTKSNLSGNTNTTSSETSSGNAIVNSFANLATAFGSGNKASTSNSTSNYKSNAYSYGGSSTTTSELYGFPLDVSVEAVSTDTNKPVWKVSTQYFLSHPNDISKAMPWIFLCTKWFVGHRWTGTINVNTKKFKEEGLYYPFDSNDWSLQYHYFNFADWYLKSEPRFDN